MPSVAVPKMKRLKLQAAVHEDKAGQRGASGIPTPARVEIEQDDGGYYLFYLDGTGQYLAHSWHDSLEDAKAQAQRQLLVQDTEWASVDR